MSRKFKPGNYVMQKPSGIPMTVTMYVQKLSIGAGNSGELVCVTWNTAAGKIRTGKFHEDSLVAFPFPVWKVERLA